jgi:hypothetical protein
MNSIRKSMRLNFSSMQMNGLAYLSTQLFSQPVPRPINRCLLLEVTGRSS